MEEKSSYTSSSTEPAAIMRKGELTEESCKIYVNILSSFIHVYIVYTYIKKIYKTIYIFYISIYSGTFKGDRHYTTSMAAKFQYNISLCRIDTTFPKNRNYDLEREHSFA